jgi:hypothetical protein
MRSRLIEVASTAPSLKRHQRSSILGAMRGRIRAFQLACALVAAMGAETSAAAGDCPDESVAGKEAERAYKLKRGGFLQEAASAFEAAYRCMPPDRKHGERWEHLASYLETVQGMPSVAPAAARAELCHARALIEDYRQSIRAVSPAPDTAKDAGAEHQRVEEELARDFPGSGPCDEPKAPEPDPLLTAPSKPVVPLPVSLPEVGAPPKTMPRTGPTRTEAAPDQRSAPANHTSRTPRARPLWIAGAVTGVASIVPAVIMGIGLRKGDQADADAATAMASGELQHIRDSIHPDGVVGNRMAYAGAIVGGALLITSVALLTAAARRTRASRAPVSALGTGLLVRF